MSKKNIIQNPRAIYACCDFSKSPFKCDYNNYITVKYRNKVKYDYSSFINPLIPGRKNVYFIINQDYLYHNFNEFTIEEGRTIDILIYPNPTTLEQFFDADYDTLSGSNTQANKDNFTYSPDGAAVAYTMASDNPWVPVMTAAGQTWFTVAEDANGNYVVTPKVDKDEDIHALLYHILCNE